MKQHLSTYIVHYANIAVAICAILAATDPKNFGPGGTAVVGAAAAGVAIAHALGINPIQALKGAGAICLLAFAMPFLGGCSTVSRAASTASTVLTSPAAQPYITAAADVAVATAESKGISAAEIYSIATQALAADQGTSATLAAVANVVNAQLAKLNLPAGDLAAAQVLELALSAAIDAQIGSNATLAQSQAAVGDILQAIITATGTAGTVPGGVTPPTTDATTVPVSPVATSQKSIGLALIESPPIVGASFSAIAVACLQAFAHLTTSAPAAAGITVLATLGAAYFEL